MSIFAARKRPSVKEAVPGFLLAYLVEGKEPGASDPSADEFFSAYFGFSEPSLRQSWEQHRGEIMRGWAERHPGRRPFAWWAWDVPVGPDGEPLTRLLIVGTAEPRRGYKPEYRWGIPLLEAKSLDRAARFESEAAFLKRLGLLEPGEEKRIASAAWLPVAVEIPVSAGGMS